MEPLSLTGAPGGWGSRESRGGNHHGRMLPRSRQARFRPSRLRPRHCSPAPVLRSVRAIPGPVFPSSSKSRPTSRTPETTPPLHPGAGAGAESSGEICCATPIASPTPAPSTESPRAWLSGSPPFDRWSFDRCGRPLAERSCGRQWRRELRSCRCSGVCRASTRHESRKLEAGGLLCQMTHASSAVRVAVSSSDRSAIAPRSDASTRLTCAPRSSSPAGVIRQSTVRRSSALARPAPFSPARPAVA